MWLRHDRAVLPLLAPALLSCVTVYERGRAGNRRMKSHMHGHASLKLSTGRRSHGWPSWVELSSAGVSRLGLLACLLAIAYHIHTTSHNTTKHDHARRRKIARFSPPHPFSPLSHPFPLPTRTGTCLSRLGPRPALGRRVELPASVGLGLTDSPPTSHRQVLERFSASGLLLASSRSAPTPV